MSGQILRAKLYIPRPGPAVVPRPHLIEQLNRGAAGKLTLLSAPAGFGKSAMLAAWAQQAHPARRVAWLSLDEADNDPARFWAYVIAALQSVLAKIRDLGLVLVSVRRDEAGSLQGK